MRLGFSGRFGLLRLRLTFGCLRRTHGRKFESVLWLTCLLTAVTLLACFILTDQRHQKIEIFHHEAKEGLCGLPLPGKGCEMSELVKVLNKNHHPIYLARPTWVKQCLGSLRIPTRLRRAILHALQESLGEFSVSGKSYGSGLISDRSAMDATPMTAFLDVEEELKSLERETGGNLLRYEQGVLHLVNKLKDAHFKYTPAYAQIMAVFLPILFSSALGQDNEQQVLVDSFNGELLSWYQAMHPTTSLKTALSKLLQKRVQRINGQPALAFFKEISKSLYGYSSDTGAAFNRLLAMPLWGLDMLPLPNSDSITMEMADGSSATLHYSIAISPISYAGDFPCWIMDCSDWITDCSDWTNECSGDTEHVDHFDFKPSCSSNGRRISQLTPVAHLQQLQHAHHHLHTSNVLPWLQPSVIHAREFVVLRLPSFTLSAEEVQSVLFDLSETLSQYALPPSLIIDLSGNEGGYLHTLYELLSVFLHAQHPEQLCRPLAVRASAVWSDVYQKLLQTLTNFPPLISMFSGAALVEQLVLYSQAAGLPYEARQAAFHCKRQLFNVSLNKKDRSGILLAAMEKVLTSQPEHFLFSSLLESQTVLSEKGTRTTMTGEVFDVPNSFRSRKMLPKVCVDLFRNSDHPSNNHPSSTMRLAERVRGIVVLSDGVCASACAQFVAAMRLSMKLKTRVVTYGGWLDEKILPSRAPNGAVYDWEAFRQMFAMVHQLAHFLTSDKWWAKSSPVPAAINMSMTLSPSTLTFPFARAFEPLQDDGTTPLAFDQLKQDSHLNAWQPLAGWREHQDTPQSCLQFYEDVIKAVQYKW